MTAPVSQSGLQSGPLSGPLAGRQVVVTQAAHQAPELAALLHQCGAVVLPYPCIAIEPPQDTAELDIALAAVAAKRYDWLVLTSANTVRVLHERADNLGLPSAIWHGIHLAAIGAATNETAVNLLGRTADVVPPESVAEGLAASLLAAVQPGQRLLLPQADLARPVLLQTLTGAGLDVVPVTAYHTVLGSGGVHLPALLAATHPTVDAITFTSSSTVRNLLLRLMREADSHEADNHESDVKAQLNSLCLAAIGPVTAGTLQSCGLTPAVVAQEQSLEGLVEALIAYWKPL